MTAGFDPAGSDPAAVGARWAAFYAAATGVLETAGFEVHTRRMTLRPVRAADGSTRFSVCNQLDTLSRIAETAGARWLCLPFVAANAAQAAEWRLAAVEVIRRFPRSFVQFIVAEDGCIYHDALTEVAQTVLDISHLSSNGFDNFRVGVGCNLRPNTPFFPFSFHDGADGFSVAVEIIETALQALESLPAGAGADARRHALVRELSAVVADVNGLCLRLEEQSGIAFKGLDISLAPYPDKRRSLANLFSLFGVEQLGHAGTLAVTSCLTNILQHVLRQTQARSTGFNGVMFSPLEDAGLAAACRARQVTIEKLMAWSTVCGCGIDMVPLAGNVLPEELAALFLDVAVVSTVLRKPLGVRVLPIPMAEANETTSFNHDFLINTRILPLTAHGLPLAGLQRGTLEYLPL